MKYFNFKRYKFSTIFKNIYNKTYSFLKVFRFTPFRRTDFKKFYKYLKIETYNINKIKKVNLLGNKFLILHLPVIIVFFGFLYFAIPTFYNYDKSKIEKIICSNSNIECLIKGKVKYNFYPTPRIIIKDLTIKETLKKKNILLSANDVSIKLSIKNLLDKQKHSYKKIEIKNYEINLDFKKFKKYQDIFDKNNNSTPIIFSKGKIIFFDREDYVASIYKTNLKFEINPDSMKVTLKGVFLNDDLYINIQTKKKDDQKIFDIIVKMSELGFLTKGNLFKSERDKNTISGNLLIKKDKNKISAIIDYKNDELIINKSNLRNTFIDGELKGKITFLPYFNFNLDVNLNSINFTKLYNHFLSLDEKDRKKLFKINNKINGDIALSADKIYSSYNLARSFESRIKFSNGNISIEQFLVNLGKLGAADFLGTISNEKKYTNFRFESNVFVDNQKKFLSKFGIYNKKSIPSNLFISGNFDIENLKASFYEIIYENDLSNSDINFVEKNFNNVMLEQGYSTLFNFPKFKEFIKSIED